MGHSCGKCASWCTRSRPNCRIIYVAKLSTMIPAWRYVDYLPDKFFCSREPGYFSNLLKRQSSGHETLLDRIQLGQFRQRRIKKSHCPLHNVATARDLCRWNNCLMLILIFHLLLIDRSPQLSKIPPDYFAILSVYFPKISACTRGKRWKIFPMAIFCYTLGTFVVLQLVVAFFSQRFFL